VSAFARALLFIMCQLLRVHFCLFGQLPTGKLISTWAQLDPNDII
jgi:hypothetical protein